MTAPFASSLPSTSRSGPVRLAVLVACFNRREVTLRCLEALYAQDLVECDLEVFLVDDASTDGTYQAVREQFPKVRISVGTGKLFWNRAMHLAFGLALDRDFDYYLWLNDDTLLLRTALLRMLTTAEDLERRGIDAIVAGNTQDIATEKHTYGGMTKGSTLRPAAYQLALPDSTVATACDTMNGNCTLIPRSVALAVGNLDPQFSHNFGDIDYGLRAKAKGFAIYMAPGFIGTCSENTDRGTWKDRHAGLRERWLKLSSPKGCPWLEWSAFTKRHLGRRWMLYAISPYLKVILQSTMAGRFQ